MCIRDSPILTAFYLDMRISSEAAYYSKLSYLAGTVYNFKTKAQCETNEGNAQFVTVQFVSIQT